MTFDEIFMFHERFIGPMQKMLGNENLGILYFAWVVPFSGIVILLFIIFFRFWLHLPYKTRMSFIIAATMYVGGTIGVELLESLITDNHGEDNLVYEFVATTQEGLEMFGIIVFIRSLLIYFAERHAEVNFSFNQPNKTVTNPPV